MYPLLMYCNGVWCEMSATLRKHSFTLYKDPCARQRFPVPEVW